VVVLDRFENLEKTLVDQVNHSASIDTVIWNGRNANYEKAPSGVYYIEIQTIDNGTTTVQGRIAALKQ
jgi:flagellar hook assembly protein FlgD